VAIRNLRVCRFFINQKQSPSANPSVRTIFESSDATIDRIANAMHNKLRQKTIDGAAGAVIDKPVNTPLDRPPAAYWFYDAALLRALRLQPVQNVAHTLRV
jgi:hypothetical protein